MKAFVLLLLLAACTPSLSPGEDAGINASAAARSPDSGPEVLIEGLDTPWGIAFLPDGRMLITERYGRVSIFDNGTLRTIAQLAVVEESESGLLGIAVDPQFETNRFVYVYYTTAEDNRVSRFTLAGDTRGLADETVLLSGIPKSTNHDGGRIRFGPDGKLYITTGDAGREQLSQDRDSLAGKILRMNPDGSIPADNPFGTLIYSLGHRNPEGLAWHANGSLYAAEHGPRQNDEINLIAPGGDYGWPQVCGGKGLQPVRCFTEFTLAPGDIAIVGDTLYVGGLRGAQLRSIDLSTGEERVVLEGMGRIREVVAHDGVLYVGTSNKDGRGVPQQGDDRILRIRLERE